MPDCFSSSLTSSKRVIGRPPTIAAINKLLPRYKTIPSKIRNITKTKYLLDLKLLKYLFRVDLFIFDTFSSLTFDLTAIKLC